MAIDFIVNRECEPKRSFGNGDSERGTPVLLDALKAKSRADMIRELASREGRDVDSMQVTVNLATPDGVESKPVTYRGLMQVAASLEQHSSSCVECPANVSQQPFGCFGVVNYPVAAEAERWLFGRLQQPGLVGAELFQGAVGDLGMKGKAVGQMRAAGMFELQKPLVDTHKLSFFKKLTRTSDQLFEGIVGFAEPLVPAHAVGVLLWVGAIAVDGQVVEGAELAQKVFALRSESEKRNRTRLAVGAASPKAGIRSMQILLAGLYEAWVHDCELIVSA